MPKKLLTIVKTEGHTCEIETALAHHQIPAAMPFNRGKISDGFRSDSLAEDRTPRRSCLT
jgi:hypothetical protein